jgi:hypothetical protein
MIVKGEHMKIKVLVIAAILLAAPLSSQASIGVKAGFNFANVTKASSINASTYTGAMVGVFLGPSRQSVIGLRTELVYSRQGYDFETNMTTGSVKLDYLILPVMLAVNLADIVQIHGGLQLAYLLGVTVKGATVFDPEPDSLNDLYHRLDYGLALGGEVSPFMGFLVGARVNFSFGKLYKDMAYAGGPPSFFPGIDSKNNVVQVYAGYRF